MLTFIFWSSLDIVELAGFRESQPSIEKTNETRPKWNSKKLVIVTVVFGR
jgi:hypothetical protein